MLATNTFDFVEKDELRRGSNKGQVWGSERNCSAIVHVLLQFCEHMRLN